MQVVIGYWFLYFQQIWAITSYLQQLPGWLFPCSRRVSCTSVSIMKKIHNANTHRESVWERSADMTTQDANRYGDIYVVSPYSPCYIANIQPPGAASPTAVLRAPPRKYNNKSCDADHNNYDRSIFSFYSWTKCAETDNIPPVFLRVTCALSILTTGAASVGQGAQGRAGRTGNPVVFFPVVFFPLFFSSLVPNRNVRMPQTISLSISHGIFILTNMSSDIQKTPSKWLLNLPPSRIVQRLVRPCLKANVPNCHTWKIESRQSLLLAESHFLHDLSPGAPGTRAHTFGQSFLKGFHGVMSSCTRKNKTLSEECKHFKAWDSSNYPSLSLTRRCSWPIGRIKIYTWLY